MKNQKGFGVVSIFILIAVAGLGFVGWRTFDRIVEKRDSQPTQINQSYTFNPVDLDTTKWQLFDPFQGFILKYPADWQIEDSGNFVTVGRRVSGLIADTRTVNVTSKDTYFFTKDLENMADENGYKRDKKSGDDISKGARIRLHMEAHEKASSAEDTCSYYNHQETEVLNFDTYKVCQVQIADASGKLIYGYDFRVDTDKVGYFLAISFSTNATKEQKDYYISVARQIVASYKLY